MALRASSLLPSNVANSLICVDLVKDHELSGRIVNPFMPEIRSFFGIKELIVVLDGFSDQIGYPQANFSNRFFDEKKARLAVSRGVRADSHALVRYMNNDEFNAQSGDILTFLLHLRSRYNATWQGIVDWREKAQKSEFRSILELIRLMTEAVQYSTGENLSPTWQREPIQTRLPSRSIKSEGGI